MGEEVTDINEILAVINNIQVPAQSLQNPCIILTQSSQNQQYTGCTILSKSSYNPHTILQNAHTILASTTYRCWHNLADRVISTTPNIQHTMCCMGHPPHQTSTSQYNHHTLMSGGVNVLFTHGVVDIVQSSCTPLMPCNLNCTS